MRAGEFFGRGGSGGVGLRSAVAVGPRSGSEAPKDKSLDRGAAAKLRRIIGIAKLWGNNDNGDKENSPSERSRRSAVQ